MSSEMEIIKPINIPAGYVNTIMLANGAVTNPILAANAVGSINVQDNAILTSKLQSKPGQLIKQYTITAAVSNLLLTIAGGDFISGIPFKVDIDLPNQPNANTIAIELNGDINPLNYFFQTNGNNLVPVDQRVNSNVITDGIGTGWCHRSMIDVNEIGDIYYKSFFCDGGFSSLRTGAGGNTGAVIINPVTSLNIKSLVAGGITIGSVIKIYRAD